MVRDPSGFEPTAHYSSPTDWEALARYLAGESSPVEAEKVRRWLAERPDDAALLQGLDRATASLAADRAPEVDVEAALARVKARRETERPESPSLQSPGMLRWRRARRRAPAVRVWRGPMLAAAAAVVVLAGASLLWRRYAGPLSGADAAERTLATTVGRRDSLVLSDGSRIVVGPGSAVTVAAGYGATGRDVTLRGEGYFDVRHDPAHPFTVRSAGATIVDVGTRFAVHSDTGLGVRVSVTAGAVRLRAAMDTDSGVVLRAGDRGLLAPGSPPVAERQRGNADDLAWIEGKLVFRDAPMTDVASDLRRWYGVQLVFADSALAHQRVNTTFEDEPLDQVLQVLALTLPATMERRGAAGDTVVVRARTGSTPPR